MNTKRVNEFNIIKLFKLTMDINLTILLFVNFKVLRNLQKSFFLNLRKMKNKGVWGYAPTSKWSKFYFIKFCGMV